MIQLHSNGQSITEKGIIELQEIVHKNPNELKTSKGFFQSWYSLLPRFKTQQDCFEYLNLMHHRKYRCYKYLSYEDFKNAKNEWLN